MDLQTALGSVETTFKTFFKGLTDEMQMCIQNCSQCAQICESTLQHCLKKGGMHASPQHIRLLQDCIEACVMSAKFMLRESPFHMQTCSVCAQVCRACADDCEQLGADDDMMKMCAEMCRRCAETCEKMAAMH